MIFEKEVVSTRIKDRSDWDISQWLESNKPTELPIGFTNFKDGNIPLDRSKVVKSEAERNAKIEKTNNEARQSKAIAKRQKEAERAKRQKELEAKRREREIQRQAQAEARAAGAVIQRKQKALQKVKEQLSRQQLVARQMELLADFRLKARVGDSQALAKMLGYKSDGLCLLASGSRAMSVKRLELLEKILPEFQYGTHLTRTESRVAQKEISHKREVWLRNHEAKKIAMEKGHRKFIGFCHKEGKETIFRIYANCKVSACVSCGKASQRKTRKKQSEGYQPAISENRKRMLVATAAGEKSFTGICKSHGETSFRVNTNNTFKCKACAAVIAQRNRERNLAELANDPRTLELRAFFRSGSRNGRITALANFLGVSITTASNYGLGNAPMPDDYYEKFLEFKAQMQGAAA